MNPVRQVVHVLGRDLREHRWLALCFTALVAIAVARVTGVSIPGAVGTLAALFLIAIGVLLAAAVTQSDSPGDPTNFWATRPLAPRSILAGKLAGFLLLTLLAATGQGIALSLLDLPLRDLIEWTALPSLLFLEWLIAAALVAAVTRDLRTTTLVVLGGLLLYILVMNVLETQFREGLRRAGPPLRVLWPFAAVALLAWVFGTRRITAARRAAAYLIAFLLPVSVTSASRGPEPAPVAGPSVPRVHGEVLLPREGDEALRVRVSGGAAGWGFQLTNTRVVARLADGRSVIIGGQGDSHTLLREAGTREVRIPLFQGDSITREALRVGVRDVAVHGLVKTTETRVVDTMPLRVGAAAARNGIRLRIVQLRDSSGQLRPRIVSSSVSRESRTFELGSGSGGARTATLLNRRTGEKVELFAQTSGTGSAWLVLPTGYEELTMEFAITPALGKRPPAPIPDEWVSDAMLILSTEVSRGSYRVVWGAR